MRSTVLLLLALACPLAAEQFVPTPAPTPAPQKADEWTMPPAELAALDALIDQAVAHGLPETRGAKLYVGELAYAAADAKNGETQQRKQIVGELHALLADGRWLLGMWTPHAVADGAIASGDAAEVAPDKLIEELAKRGGERNERGYEQFISRYPEAERPRLRAALPFIPVWELFSGTMGIEIPVLELRRAGVPGIERMLPVIAAVSQRLRPAGDAKRLVLLPGHQARRGDDENAKPAPLPTTEVQVRAALTDFFRARLIRGGDGPAIAQAREAVLALSPAEDRAELGAQLDQLAARAKLPAKPDASADLPTRLAAWSPNLREQEEPDFEGDIPPEVVTRIQDRQPKPLVGEGDLAGLVLLAGDERPSRWLDGRAVRTLGDNALRAIAWQLRFDPRVLAGRDPEAPWTHEERAATAAALAAWWDKNGAKGVPALRQELFARMDLEDAVAVLRGAKGEERTRLLDTLAQGWAATPPTAAKPMWLGALLALAGDHAGLAEQVRKLPVAGDQRLLLAVWRALHGDEAELDKLVAEIAAPDRATDAKPALGAVFTAALAFPAMGRQQQLAAMTAGALDGKVAPVAICHLLMDFGFRGDDGVGLLLNDRHGYVVSSGNDEEKGDARRAQRSYLIYSLLVDQRPLPKGAVTDEQGTTTVKLGDSTFPLRTPGDEDEDSQPPGKGGDAAKPAAPKPIADDLRVCDLAAAMARQYRWTFGLNEMPPFDPAAAAADRDQQLEAVRAVLAPKVKADLAAAKLPEELPNGGAKDPKSLF